MAVTLNKANLVLKDANGNIGKIEQLSNRDLAKIKTAMSDVALVVNQSNHKPIVATTTNVGVVKPDNKTITIDSNGVLTATKAIQDSEGQQINTTYVKGVTASNATITVTKGNGITSTVTINNVANATNAVTSSKLQNARVLAINDTLGNLGKGVSFDGSKNVTISLPPYIANQLLRDKTKNYGNDYYDDSGITSLIYAGNGSGTVRAELAEGNFERLHPGQYIRGRVTGTTYVVVGCNIYRNLGNTELIPNHIGLMPIWLEGNADNLLWSGRTYAGSGVNNTKQGYAPWASDNNTEGKNQTSCYKDSYIAKTVLPKVDNLWLKPDFENQGISVLTFKSIDATYFDTNATCMSNPNWRGCTTGWQAKEVSRRLVLPSEPEIYGHYQWAGSPLDSMSQHTQLPLYRHKEIHKVFRSADIWLKDSASASYACLARYNGTAFFETASYALRVCPIFLIA